MGITDKVTGRIKQAAGDLLGDDEVKREGVVEERKGEEKDELAKAEAQAERAENKADRQAKKVERLERAS